MLLMIENFYVANDYDKSHIRKDGIVLLNNRNARSSLLANSLLESRSLF